MLARGGEETREHDKDAAPRLASRSTSPGFRVDTNLKVAGDQPDAIEKILKLFQGNEEYVTLHGATGTGKTLVLAKVIEELKKPTLILCHNKALAEQLHAALEKLLPGANVRLYLSALEKYTPATVDDSDLYRPATNGDVDEEAAKRRGAAMLAVSNGWKHTIVVASTAAIFPSRPNMLGEEDEDLTRAGLTPQQEKEFIKAIESALEKDLSKADEQVQATYEHLLQKQVSMEKLVGLFQSAIHASRKDRLRMLAEKEFGGITGEGLREVLEEVPVVARRAVQLEDFVTKDLCCIERNGTCSELYDKYGVLLPASARGTLLQKFVDSYADDWLLVFDESHASVPAFSKASKASISRLKKLAKGGYRLGVVADGPAPGGPLSEERIWALKPSNTVFISATPGKEELKRCEAEAVVKMVQRPTHILDPVVEVKDQGKQMREVIGEMRQVCNGNGQVIMATRTQKEAEAMSLGLSLMGIRADFVHCGLESSIRNCKIEKFRQGGLQVLIGIGLIMEGLDFPRVELVVILDSHKGGLHRNQRCFEQLAGRAARNTKGRVFLCSSEGRVTKAMNDAMDAMRARREAQMAYNKANRLEPIPVESEASPDSSSSSTSSQLPTALGEDEVGEGWRKKPERLLTNDQLIDWMALVGSKAIWTEYAVLPGCDGIGPGRAWELIEEHGSLVKVLKANHEGKLRQNLRKFWEQALINKEKVLMWQRWHLVPGVQSSDVVERSYYRIARDLIPRAPTQAQPEPATPTSEAAREPGSALAPVEEPAFAQA